MRLYTGAQVLYLVFPTGTKSYKKTKKEKEKKKVTNIYRTSIMCKVVRNLIFITLFNSHNGTKS